MRQAQEINRSEDGKRILCIDVKNSTEIMQFIDQNEKFRKKFAYISQIVLKNTRVPDLYDKEDHDDSCKDVTAMKFFKGGANGRIYCKEISVPGKSFVIIASEVLFKKKSQKNDSRSISLIKKVASYEYEIIEKPRQE